VTERYKECHDLLDKYAKSGSLTPDTNQSYSELMLFFAEASSGIMEYHKAIEFARLSLTQSLKSKVQNEKLWVIMIRIGKIHLKAKNFADCEHYYTKVLKAMDIAEVKGL
jgi:hypothetical protein